MVFLAFNGGGYFAGATGALAAAFGVVLILRLTLASEPFAGLGRLVAAAAAALGLFCAWVLASAGWSDAPARAMIEFDRALLYWLALFLFGSLAYTPRRLAWATRLVALAIVGICTVSLITRLLPDVWTVRAGFEIERLSYPLTYWNALGLLAALGTVLCLHLAASEREPAAVRVAGAGALPLLGTCLYFTFSRGAIAALAVGLVVYVLVARPRGLLSGLLATVGPLVLVLSSAYGAERLSGDNPTSAAATAEGHDLALVLALAIVAAVVLRVLLLKLDSRLAAIGPDRRPSRAVLVAGSLLVVAALAIGAVGAGVPDRLADQYDGFVEGAEVSSEGDLRARLTDPGNNGRLDQWRVAQRAFEAKPVAGEGAGTFAETWARERNIDLKVEDAHSLYLELLAEVGIVGLALILIVFGVLIAGIARRARGDTRHLHAALLAAFLVWALHAGIDWDWEVPAVGLWLFALGGLALARSTEERALTPGRFARVLLSVVVLALLVTPVTMALSQNRLNATVDAFKAGDCERAVDTALAAIDAVPARPEPYQLLGMCDARLGEHALAIDMLETAVSKNRDDWSSWYVLGLVRAAGGEDPRPAIRQARRLNPRELLVIEATDAFASGGPRAWKRRALKARLPIQ